MNRFIKIFLIASVMISISACGTSSTSNAPVFPPTMALVEPLTLKSNPISEEGQAPNYKITAQIPYLDPATETLSQTFNDNLKNIVEGEIAAFKGSMAEMPATPIAAGSSLDIQYQLIGQKGNIWSIQFNIMGYADGAAHPYHYSIPVNYDLKASKDVTLDDVFLPNSNYLQVISEYCKTQLSTRDIGFEGDFQQGVNPTPENYRNWNVSGDGLVITFDEYQVAPYAAGPQTVTIPFADLASVINPQGALAPFLQ